MASWKCARRSTPSARRAALRRRDGRTCVPIRSTYSLHHRAEESHVAHLLDTALREAARELTRQVTGAVAGVVDDLQVVEEIEDRLAAQATPRGVSDQAVAEDLRAG